MFAKGSISFRLCFLLTLVLFSVVTVLPIGHVLWNSLHDETGFTLAGYRSVLTDARQWGLLKNSLLVATGTAFVATFLGAAVALALERLRVPGRRVLAYGVAVPFLVPPYIAAIAWIDAFGTNGLLHRMLNYMGWSISVPSVSTIGGVIFVSALSYYPVVVLTTALALRRLDYRLEEAAALSVSRAQAFRGVILPLLTPSIATGTFAVFALSLVGFAVPSLLQVNVYPVEIFTSFSAFYDVPAATAQALPVVVCGIVVLALGMAYIGPRRAWLSGASRARDLRNKPKRTALPYLAGVVTWALALISGALPLSILVWRSLPRRWYVEVVSTAKEEILTSVITAGASATVITMIAFAVAYFSRPHHTTVVHSRFPSARRGLAPNALLFLGLLPFLVSGPVIGIALIGTWNRPGVGSFVYDSLAVVVLACIARYVFFAQHTFGAALRDIHASVEEAAAVAGVSWQRQVSGILLPLLRPVIVGTWGLSFILSLGELDATALVCPPGATTLPVRIFSLMHYGPSRLVAALSVITALLILVCAAATAILYSMCKRERHGYG